MLDLLIDHPICNMKSLNCTSLLAIDKKCMNTYSAECIEIIIE